MELQTREISDLNRHLCFVFKHHVFSIFDCAQSSLLRVGLHCFVWVFIAFSSCHERASHRHGFSCCRARSPGIEGFSSCGGMGAQLLCGMGVLPGPGIKPVSLAWQGRFLTAGPPEKPDIGIFN